MLSVVIAIYNTCKQLSRHNTEDLCVCAGRAMLSAVVFTNGRQMAYALGYYRGLGERLSSPCGGFGRSPAAKRIWPLENASSDNIFGCLV